MQSVPLTLRGCGIGVCCGFPADPHRRSVSGPLAVRAVLRCAVGSAWRRGPPLPPAGRPPPRTRGEGFVVVGRVGRTAPKSFIRCHFQQRRRSSKPWYGGEGARQGGVGVTPPRTTNRTAQYFRGPLALLGVLGAALPARRDVHLAGGGADGAADRRRGVEPLGALGALTPGDARLWLPVHRPLTPRATRPRRAPWQFGASSGPCPPPGRAS